MSFDDVFNTVFNEIQLNYIQYAKTNKNEYIEHEDDFIGVYLYNDSFFTEVESLVCSKESMWAIIEHYIDNPEGILVGYYADYDENSAPIDFFIADISNKMLQWTEENKERIDTMVVSSE